MIPPSASWTLNSVVPPSPSTVEFQAKCPCGHDDATWYERPGQNETVRGYTVLWTRIDCPACGKAT